MTVGVISASPVHTERIHALQHEIVREGEMLIKAEPPDLEAVVARLERIERNNEICLLLVDGDDVVGMAEAGVRRFEGMTHAASLEFAVRRSHRAGGGVKMLLDAMIGRCDVAGMWRLELCLLPTNELMVNLAGDTGFMEEGRSPRSRIVDGIELDFIHFARLLDSAPEPLGLRPDPEREDSVAGAEIELVAAEESHASDIDALVDGVARERRWIGQVESRGVDAQSAFINYNREHSNPHFLAMDGSRVVGWIDIVQYQVVGQEHVAGLGMGLRPGYRGQGIGSRLMTRALDAARAVGIRQVILEVYGNNIAAQALYRRFGFETTCIRRRCRRLDGYEEDLVVMQVLLDD